MPLIIAALGMLTKKTDDEITSGADNDARNEQR